MNALYRLVPLLDWIRHYGSYDLRSDMNAGVIVAIMLIPQGMAYAVLAGVPPVYGLYASIFPLLLYPVFGTSRHLSLGPVALVSILVAAGVGQYAEVGSDEFIRLTVVTAMGVGVVLFLMGVLRLGFIVKFLSKPVLSGFISAAAVIIAASQIRNLLGLDLPGTKFVHEVFLETYRMFYDIEPFVASIGIVSIVFMLVMKKWKYSFPSAIFVLAVSSTVTALFGLDSRGVAVVGEIPRGLPSFSVAEFGSDELFNLYPMILAIALIAYLESIAVAKSIADRHGYKISSNQELVALGLSNIGGSLFQSIPVAGGISRTAVADQAGGKTGMTSVIAALIVGITVLFLTPLFYYLPNAVLAAIIIVAVTGLFDAGEMLYLWRTDRTDLVMLFVTFFVTLFGGIEWGIAFGVVISLIVVIYVSTKPHWAELGRLGDSRNFRNINRYREAVVEDDILIFRFDSQLYFANADYFSETLKSLIHKREENLRLVVIDASSIHLIDSTGMGVIKELIEDLRSRGVLLYIASAIGPVRDKLKRSGIVDVMGENNFFLDVAGAVDHYRGNVRTEYGAGSSPMQTDM